MTPRKIRRGTGKARNPNGRIVTATAHGEARFRAWYCNRYIGTFKTPEEARAEIEKRKAEGVGL